MCNYIRALFNSRMVTALCVLFIACATTVQADIGKSLPKIKNFGQISDTYYRGAQPEGQDYADLAAFGIKTVINLTSHDADKNEKALVEKAGMTYVQIAMDTRINPTPAQLADFLRITGDSASQPVYVHCVGGKHRTGVMTAVYRMVQGWNADQAYDEMKKYKFGASLFHPEFKKFVFDYYTELKQASVVPAQTPANTAATVTAQ